MKKLFGKRVICAVLTLVLAFSAVLPQEALAFVQNRTAALIKPTTQKDYNKLLYGTEKDEKDKYYLGIAGHFSLFGQNVVINPNNGCYSDADGRIAADEFKIASCPNGGFPIKGFLTNDSLSNPQQANANINGAAAVICNNAKSRTFGYVNQNYNGVEHIYVVSDKVTSLSDPGQGNSYINDAIRKTLVYLPENKLINFNNEMAALRTKSANLASQTVNGTVKAAQGKLILTGSNTVNYFRLTEAQWNQSANGITLNIPSGAYAVISVEGKTVNIKGGQTDCFYIGSKQISQSSSDNSRVLFNFFEAEQVNLYNALRGCILAPSANVTDKYCGYGHHAGQIVAKSIDIKCEMGHFGFNLPKEYVKDCDPQYTVHYMYYGTDGKLYEIPASVYKAFIGTEKAPMPDTSSKGFKKGESVTALVNDAAGSNKAAVKNAMASSDMSYYAELLENGCGFKFEVYEDGKKWADALSGSGLLNTGNYKNMTRKDDIDWTTEYTFGNSNVYFVLYPTAKVTVDVMWDDKQNKDFSRPDASSFAVTLNERFTKNGSTSVTAREKVNPLNGSASVVSVYDEAIDKNVSYDKFVSKYTYDVPVLGSQVQNGSKTGASYGVSADRFGENGLFDISYSVPEGYVDTTVTKVDANGFVDADGVVAQYHIVLRKQYKATFYLVDPDGERIEVYKDGFYDEDADDYTAYLGSETTGELPELSDDEIDICLGEHSTNSEYTIYWRDVATGKLYAPGEDVYTFDYEDAEFETILRPVEIVRGKTPWLYCHIISFNDHYLIPGSAVYSRLTADKNADEYVFIQKRNAGLRKAAPAPYAYDEELKEGQYKDDQFMLISMVYGVDEKRAEYSRITISNEGFGHDAAIFYETQNNKNLVDAFCDMPGRKASAKVETAKLLSHDPYVKDYDGLNVLRLVVPAEYEDDTLYLTVYYTDEEGRESVWFYYTFYVRDNKFWSIQD